jgi:hypothetical protein
MLQIFIGAGDRPELGSPKATLATSSIDDNVNSGSDPLSLNTNKTRIDRIITCKALVCLEMPLCGDGNTEQRNIPF